MTSSGPKQAWREGRVAFNYWMAAPSVSALQALEGLGYDSVLFDMQHTALELGDIHALLAAMDRGIGTPLVRVPWNDPIHIQRVLDFGAGGVVCPMVNTRADAEAFVGACRYPPAGWRSFGPFRAAGAYGGREAYFEVANDEIVTIAQIETMEALHNLGEIVTTPGLDAVMVGPGDLSVSAGRGPMVDYADATVAGWHRSIADGAHEAGGKAMMLAMSGSEDEIELIAGWGADLISLSNDLTLQRASATAILSVARQVTAARTRPEG